MKIGFILLGLLVFINAFSMDSRVIDSGVGEVRYDTKNKRLRKYENLYFSMNHERRVLSKYVDSSDPFKYMIISKILYLINKKRLGYTLELVVYFVKTVANSNLANLVIIYDESGKPTRLTANKTRLVDTNKKGPIV